MDEHLLELVIFNVDCALHVAHEVFGPLQQLPRVYFQSFGYIIHIISTSENRYLPYSFDELS